MADSTTEEWLAVAGSSSIPLAAGENIADTASFTEANSSSWLSIMQPDLCKWGGFSGVLPVAREAIANGKKYCPHYLGGGVGLIASAHILAAVGPSVDSAGGVHGLLEVDSNPNPLREQLYSPEIDNGRTVISEAPGLGIDPQELFAFQNDPLISTQVSTL